MSLTHAICMRITFTVQFPCWWKQFCLKLTGNLQGVWGVCFHAALLSKCIMNHYLKKHLIESEPLNVLKYLHPLFSENQNKPIRERDCRSSVLCIDGSYCDLLDSLRVCYESARRQIEGQMDDGCYLWKHSHFSPIILLLNLCLSHKKIHNCHQVRIFFFSDSNCIRWFVLLTSWCSSPFHQFLQLTARL